MGKPESPDISFWGISNLGSSASCVVGQTRMTLRGGEVVEFIA
jgi:hypothetical protein